MPWSLPLAGLAALSAAMALAWRRQRSTGDAGIVDLVWTAGIGALALLYCAAADGYGPRRALVAALAGAWSLRLSLHLAARLRTGVEDGRYRQLRESLGARFQGWMFWFFQAQALLAVLLSLVFLVLASARAAPLGPWELAGTLLFAAALAGESAADRQLARFRADPANRGRTCRAGLWRFSRHPNYFFEWLHWVAWAVLGASVERGALLWLAPAAMLFLVLRVTGVPPTERQALRSRGEDYRAYQRTTSTFFPWPPRGSSSGSRSTT